MRIRQALNVESGLNDGLALPALLLALALAGGEIHPVSYWVGFISLQLVMGPLAGAAVGYFGGRLVELGVARGWITPTFTFLSVLSLAIAAYGLAGLMGGNGFIAVFCAGLTVGAFSERLRQPLHSFGEAEGELLTLITFLIFGAILLPLALPSLTWMHVVYAMISLTIIRMVPVALCLAGTHLRPATILFLGWFGPRGIASVLYVLLIFEHGGISAASNIFTIAVITVAMSIVLHGVTAVPAAERYGRYMAKQPPSPEHRDVPEFPTRHPAGNRSPRRGFTP